MWGLLKRLAGLSAGVVETLGGPRIGGGLDRGSSAPELFAETWINASGDGLQLRSGQRPVPLFVEFWSTQCKPCVASIEKIRRAHAGYAWQTLHVVTIHVNLHHPDPPLPDLERFVKARAIEYLVGVDYSGECWRRFAFTHLPHGLLIGSDGNVHWSGSLFNNDVTKVLASFFGETVSSCRAPPDVATSEIPDFTLHCDGGACELPHRAPDSR